MFNEGRAERGEALLTSYSFGLRDGVLRINDNLSFDSHGTLWLQRGSEQDVLTKEEWDLIENTLRARSKFSNHAQLFADVSLEYISIGMKRLDAAFTFQISLVSPARDSFRWQNPIWRTYLIEFNDYWSVHIGTNMRR